MPETENITFFENVMLYLMDLVEVFYLIIYSDAVQRIYKNNVTDVYNEPY
jgi:hypothetical protein